MVLIRDEDIIDYAVENWSRLHTNCPGGAEKSRPYFDKERNRYTLLCDVCVQVCPICFDIWSNCGHWIEEFYWDEVTCASALKYAVEECSDTVRDQEIFQIVDEKTTKLVIYSWYNSVIVPIEAAVSIQDIRELFDSGFDLEYPWTKVVTQDIASAVYARSELEVYEVHYPDPPGVRIAEGGFTAFFCQDAKRAYSELAQFFDFAARELLHIVAELT